MPHVIVAGGGLAGLAAAAALGGAGYTVDLFEMRGFLGGRATSYPAPASEDAPGEVIDNCQHILLRCCANLLDFYGRLGVADRIQFHDEFFFIEPGGRMSRLKAGILPRPLHFTGSFLSMQCLSLSDKLALARGILALQRERTRTDLDQITMQQWLEEHGQPPRVIERFWRQVLVSAINEELDRMAAAHGFQVFWLGFLANKRAYEMGVPAIPLGDLYGEDRWAPLSTVRLRMRMPVERIELQDGRVAGVVAGGERHVADYYISSLPFERMAAALPELPLPLEALEHSPITGIHLWFDRPVTDLPHGTLLDRTIQWFFNKDHGRYLQVVVSASRSMIPMGRREVIDLAVKELAEFLPLVKEAKLEKAHVVKEARATFSAKPGLEALRPLPATVYGNLFLAGDWTRTGWPATMEGAVKSGYLAAEALSKAAGRDEQFVRT
jgi:squalene-associated FAD-dependent desaturase